MSIHPADLADPHQILLRLSTPRLRRKTIRRKPKVTSANPRRGCRGAPVLALPIFSGKEKRPKLSDHPMSSQKGTGAPNLSCNIASKGRKKEEREEEKAVREKGPFTQGWPVLR